MFHHHCPELPPTCSHLLPSLHPQGNQRGPLNLRPVPAETPGDSLNTPPPPTPQVGTIPRVRGLGLGNRGALGAAPIWKSRELAAPAPDTAAWGIRIPLGCRTTAHGPPCSPAGPAPAPADARRWLSVQSPRPTITDVLPNSSVPESLPVSCGEDRGTRADDRSAASELLLIRTTGILVPGQRGRRSLGASHRALS